MPNPVFVFLSVVAVLIAVAGLVLTVSLRRRRARLEDELYEDELYYGDVLNPPVPLRQHRRLPQQGEQVEPLPPPQRSADPLPLLLSACRLFVSHSSEDDDFGVELVKDLRRVFGSGAVWYDSRGGLSPGDRWFRRIEEEVVGHDVFLIVLSPSSMSSDWVRREFDIALNEKKRVVPVLYQPCEMWPYLRTVQYVSFLPPKSYRAAFDELLKALSAEKSG